MKKEVDLLNSHYWLTVINSLDQNKIGITEEALIAFLNLKEILEEDFLSCLKKEVAEVHYENQVNTILNSCPQFFSAENNLIILNYFAEKKKTTADDVLVIFQNLTEYLKNLPENEQEKALVCLEKFISKSRNCLMGLAIQSLSLIYAKYPNLNLPKRVIQKIKRV